MKILMTVMMTLLTTVSAHAADACKLGAVCTLSDCKALNSDYGLAADGKCVNPTSTESTVLDDCKQGLSTGTPTSAPTRDGSTGADGIKPVANKER